MGTAADGRELFVGRGKLYFDRFDKTTGLPTGERYVGNCASLDITSTPDQKDFYSSDDDVSGLLASVVNRIAQEFSIELNQYNRKNLALVFLGEDVALAQTAATVTAESHTGVVADTYVQLANRHVTAVAVTKAPSTLLTLDTDYKVDAEIGRIYIVPGGALDAGGDILVDYTAPTLAGFVVKSGTQGLIEGSLRYIGKPVKGPRLDVRVWRVSMIPDGVLPLTTQDFASYKLKGRVLQDLNGHPDSPYFETIPLDELVET